MAHLLDAWNKRRPSTRFFAALALCAGVMLCLLVVLNVLLRPSGAVNLSSPVSLTLGTPGHVTPSRAEQRQTVTSTSLASPDAGTPGAASRAVTIAGTPDAAAPAGTATPTPTAVPLPTAVKSPTPANPVVPAVAEASATSTIQTQAQTPITRVRIPRIGVNAPVEIKSLDGDGVMQAPDSPSVVAWYDFSARPGTEGNTVFAGHLDFAGVGPAVFWDLGKLQPGDEIDVADEDGRSFRYRVASVRSYAVTADAGPIVASGGSPTITLITCDGTFNRATGEYNQRIVVSGTLVS
jgi:LPXTG-site transpeptidase (sortase) family protein